MGTCFIKAILHVVNESEQREIICNNLRLIPLDEMQTVFKLSPSLFSHFHRFRRAAESASFPPGEAKEVCTNSPWCILNGILRTAGNPSGAMRRLSFALSSCTPFCEWLHLLNLSGEVKLGSPVGELSSVSETEGVWFVEW